MQEKYVENILGQAKRLRRLPHLVLHIFFENILGRAKRLRRLPHFMLHIFFENIPHEEVFRECTIFGIFFDFWIAKQDKQIDMRSCLSKASSSNDSENRTFGLRAQDVFALFLFASVFFLVTERK